MIVYLDWMAANPIFAISLLALFMVYSLFVMLLIHSTLGLFVKPKKDEPEQVRRKEE